LGEPLLGAVVELGRARALMRSHFLRVLERAAVRKIRGDPGRPEGVAADRLGDAGGRGAAPDHAPSVGLTHRLVGKSAAVVAARGPKQPGELNLADKNVACLHVRLHLCERTFLQPVRSREVCPFADPRIRD
jgi:hypothetical protein